ncbi:MAG: IclR family transcriptional regulator C-terminal domain-containing protein, partial [Pseudomonadota bacterium]
MGTITKSLNLLNFFSESVPEIGLIDFKKLTGQDKATIHRHLTELQENGFLEQNPENKKYRLGAAILRLASVRETTFPTEIIVSQRVRSLSEELGELVHASLISATDLSSLCFNDGGVGGTRVYFSEAEILPLHATASGIAALAFGQPHLLENVGNSKPQKYTDATVTDTEAILGLVMDTRERGFAITDQSFEPEVSSMAVPFFENNSFAYGTIAV